MHGNKGKEFTKEHKRKLSEAHKGKPSGYRGVVTSNSYMAVHHWAQRYIPKKNRCENCQKDNCRLELANLDHSYNRNPDDWRTMCNSCHRIFDILNNNYYENWIRNRKRGELN